MNLQTLMNTKHLINIKRLFSIAESANTHSRHDTVMRHHLRRSLVKYAIIFTLALNLFQIAPSFASNNITNPQQVSDVDILALNDEIKALLDRVVRPQKTKVRKVEALHTLLFGEAGLDIQYDFSRTYTAQQAFEERRGNCVSMASLFLSSARYLGLKAYFQTVEVPRTWEPQGDYYLVPGHVNVVVQLAAHDKIIVEVLDTYFNSTNLKSKRISDASVLAKFYNNKGSEALAEDKYQLAIAYFKKSTKTDKKASHAWSNLGVAHRLNGSFKLAEKAYLKSLKVNPRNISVINNLYALYRTTDQHKKAEKYLRKVERYSKKNPYYLAKLAETDLNQKNYENALRVIKKAIKIKPKEPGFHHTLAKIHYKLGNLEGTRKEIALAEHYAQDEEVKNKYRHKLDQLSSLYRK